MRQKLYLLLLPMVSLVFISGCGSDLVDLNGKRKADSHKAQGAQLVYCEDVAEQDDGIVVEGNYSTPPMTYPGYYETDCIPSSPSSPVVVVDPGRARHSSEHFAGQRPQHDNRQPPFTYPGPGQGGPITQNNDLDPFYY